MKAAILLLTLLPLLCPAGENEFFTHSLHAFNAAVAEPERLPPEFIRGFYAQQKVPEGTPEAQPDPLYGNKLVLFRRVSGNTRVTTPCS